MKSMRTVRIAVAALAAAGLVAGSFVPAHGATRSTVVIHDTNPLTGFNSSVSGYNLTANTAVGYLTGMCFNYYDDKKNLVKNPVFGTYKIVKNSQTDFRVQYTVNPGRVWSDGTSITGVDLLLSHVLCSNKYAIAAGLGDPAGKVASAFNASCYSGTYNDFIVGDPVLSDDKMSVTVQYKGPLADWELYGPGPAPVHALILMSEGKKALQSVADNEAAKARFLAAYQTKNTDVLKAIAKVWSNDYNINTVDATTNPLLLISNGGFIVTGAVAKQSVTMKANAKYNSGPAMSGSVDTVVYKHISDGNAATQALANGEIDLYQGQATADAVAQLKAMKGVSLANGTSACYEHIDLRTAAVQGSKDVYTGVFAASSAAGADLRKAFLLAYPREEIVAKIVKPVNSSAVVPNSTFVMPGQSNYDYISKNNGSSFFSQGTQEQRTAKALSIVKKYYPNASSSNPVVPVKLELPSPNVRRAAEAALVVPALAKAGFKVNAVPTTGWSGKLDNTEWDAQFYAWCPSAVLQTGTNDNFLASGGNNHMGWNFPDLDAALRKLESVKTDAVVNQYTAAAERLVNSKALTLAIFQHPAVTAYNSDLKNVKPAPLSPTLVWNYWEWTY